jgi:tetratricopeptide (TPR) repeat protein
VQLTEGEIDNTSKRYQILPLHQNADCMKQLFLLVSVCLIVFIGCTPKVAIETQAKEEVKPTLPKTSDDPCATFEDSRMGENALNSHVIYRDFIRYKKYMEALPYWREAYTYAPAADGKRQTHYEDGIDIYEYIISTSLSDTGKRIYLDSIFDLYDKMGDCYHQGDEGYIAGRKGFDLYYKYRDFIKNDEIFSYFTKALDTDQLETQSFVINPFTALLVEMFRAKQISQDVAVKYARLILDICEHRIDDEEDGWPVVVGYAPVQLEAFETVRGFYDCEYYKDKYFEPVDLTTVDCEEIFLIATQLKYGGCDIESPELIALGAEYSKRCRVGPSPLLSEARTALEEDRYRDAIELYLEYLEDLDDSDRLAQFNLRISKIYYGHVRDFRKAREYAYKALKYRPNWGEPYIVIGKLYASSGPLCGPGRGWDSQIVTWPAIDKFRKAKAVDPSVAAEANKWIAYYQKYMPSVEDIFQRQLKAGDAFKVGCWIQENTTIRPATK